MSTNRREVLQRVGRFCPQGDLAFCPQGDLAYALALRPGLTVAHVRS